MVERRHGGVGPLEELWHPEQLTKDAAGKSLVGGMLLERVGSAALLYLLVASTPCMGGLLCEPSGEVGRRGNFCLFCICISVVVVIAAVGSTDLLPFTKGRMSDSLGAAPLAQFAPASLTSAPPGTRTGMETEEAVGTRRKKKRNNSGGQDDQKCQYDRRKNQTGRWDEDQTSGSK